MTKTFQKALERLINGETLTRDFARSMMDQIMNGEATANQISGFLSVLRFRGETSEELTGFAESLRQHADRLVIEDKEILDTCGTGGDGASTFNISTAVAILVSGLDVKVAKHGNRAVSSKSGSADVIEALGLSIPKNKNEAIQDLKAYNMCFLYAPSYHASLKHAVIPRKELGFRTVFNLLGPLANPAGSHRQLLGVYNHQSAVKMAEALCQLGTERALLVTGDQGLDEIAITGPTEMLYVHDETITSMRVTPEELGVERGRLEDIQVANVKESAMLIEAIFSGKAHASATNIVALNAGAALFLAGKSKDFYDGVILAKQAIKDGVGYDQLSRMRSSEVEDLRHA